MRFVSTLLMLLGRICISAVFLVAGVSKLFNYHETVQYMAAHGLTMMTPVLYLCALIVEILIAFCLLIGFKSRWAAAILALFLIPTSFLFHNFWDFEGEDRVLQMTMFLKNLGIFGGLLFLIGVGGSVFACDHFCRKSKQKEENSPK